MARIIVMAIATGVLAIPAAAAAEPASSGGFQLRARVAELCEIDADPALVDNTHSDVRLDVHELCNGAHAFQVTASYRPLQAGETIQILYAGEGRALDPSGMSEIANRFGPTVANVPVSISANGLKSDVAISFGISSI